MNDSRRLALELHEIRMLALAHATNPQFGNSSVDGEGILFRDADGNNVGRIGGDEGGLEVEYVYGPKPLMPSTPIVSADANLILVRWDGSWSGTNADGGSAADPDLPTSSMLDRVEIHVSMDPNFVPDPIESFAGVMPVTGEGGQVTVGPLSEAGDYYVVLLARGKDGQYSAPSERVHVVTTVGAMENELFDLALRADEAMESADGKNSVYYGDDEPEAPEGGFKDGDLWFGPENMPHVWNPEAGDDGEWASARDERFDAVQDAIDGLDDAVQNISISGGGTVTYWWDSPPDGSFDPPPKEGDLWFDTSGEANKLHRFSDGQWQSAADGRIEAIQDAYDLLESDLDEVRTSASGKNRTFYQSTMPTTPPAQAGDLWFNTANGMRLHRNNGTTFIEVADGRIADLQDDVENIDISGPLSEARNEWLADAADDAQAKAQAAAAAAEAAAKLYADQIAAGVEDVDLEGFKDYADNAAEAARQAAIAAAIAEARLIADDARDEALQAALDADLVISGALAEFENDLDLVRQSADGKSRITYSTAVASGPGRAGDSWFRYAGTRLIGQWRHNGSSWVEMSLDPVVIPNLDAGKLTSGFIGAGRIAGGSITADKLIVGGGQNMLTNPLFANGALGWEPVYGSTVNETGGPDGEPTIVYPPATENRFSYLGSVTASVAASLNPHAVAVEPGLEYRVRVKVRSSGPVSAGGVGLGIRARKYGSAELSWSVPGQVMNASALPANEWQTVEGVVRAPAGFNLLVFGFRMMAGTHGHTIEFAAPSLVPVVGGVLIADGAITAGKISAGAVGATAIAAESIDASKIVAGGIQAESILVPGSVSGTLIKDGAVTTDKIQAGSITAQSGIIASLDAGVISSGFISAARIQAGSLDGGVVLTQGSVGSTVIAGGSITTEKIATGSITAESGIIASLDAGKITVGELDGSIIRAGTVTAEKLLVGNFTNLIPDPGALGSIHGSWYGYGSGSVGELGSSAFWRYSATSQGYRGVRVGNTEGAFGSAQWLASSKFQVKPGESYLIEVIAYRSELVGGFPRMGIRLGDADDAYMGETETVVMDQGGFHTYSAIVTIPNDLTIKYGRLRYTIPSSVTGGYAYFFSPVVRPAVGSTLIEPGAITTEHIRTGAITAESGIIGSLDAGVITTGELRGELIRAQSIAASALAADAIDGKVITGATVRTSAAGARVEMNSTGLYVKNQFGANTVSMQNGTLTVEGGTITGGTVRTSASGARVQMDVTGLKAWNPSGAQTFMISANTGTVDMTGDLKQVNSWGRLRVGPTLFSSSASGTGGPGISLDRASPPSGVHPAGMLLADSVHGGSLLQVQGEGAQGKGWSYLNLVSSDSGGDTGLYRDFADGAWSGAVLTDGGLASIRSKGNATSVSAHPGGGILMSSGTDWLGVGYYGAARGPGIHIQTSANMEVWARGRKAIDLRSDGTGQFFQSDTIYYRTYTNASANLYITGSQVVGRASSSRRYKLDERPIATSEYADRLLSIDYKSWVDRTEQSLYDEYVAFQAENPMCPAPERLMEAPREAPTRAIGAIAEDFVDAGLTEFVQYDEFGQTQGISYDRIGVALIPIVRELRDRINDLEKKVADV